jgi:hypothetical protein
LLIFWHSADWRAGPFQGTYCRDWTVAWMLLRHPHSGFEQFKN